MAKNLPISEVKARLTELVAAVEQDEEEVVVTRNGKPVAVLVNYEYKRELETLDVLRDPNLMQQIRNGLADIAAGEKGLSFEEVFGEPLARRRKKRR
jgi:prevent-host-death family protein